MTKGKFGNEVARNRLHRILPVTYTDSIFFDLAQRKFCGMLNDQLTLHG